MISESMYSWCAVSVFDIPLWSKVSARGAKWQFCRHHLEIGTKNKKFLENLRSAAIDLILAMTVLFSYMTLTLRKSRVHCCGAMHFWACGSLMSAIACRGRLRNLRAVGSKIGLYFVTITWQQRFIWNYPSRRFAACECWKMTSVAGNAARQWLLSPFLGLFAITRGRRLAPTYIWREQAKT